MNNLDNIGVPSEIYVEHTCDFADKIMQDRLGKSYNSYLLGNDELGYAYTEDGQGIFNEILDDVESFLAKLNVVNQSYHL